MQSFRRFNHAERFQLQLSGVYCLRLHRSAAWDRWTGGHCGKPVSDGSVSEGDVSVLRTEGGPVEGAGLGRGWISAVVQTAGAGQLSMAEDEERGSGFNAAATPLADGGAKNRAAESAQAGDRAEHDIIEETVENIGLLGIFVV